MSQKSIYKNSCRETFAEIPPINNLPEKIEREANIEYYKMLSFIRILIRSLSFTGSSVVSGQLCIRA